MSHDRRRFLKHATASGLALASLPSVLSAASTEVPETEERTRIDELNEFVNDYQQQPKTEFDISWTEKLTGKYRAVFDTPSIKDGSGVWRAGTWATHYKEV